MPTTFPSGLLVASLDDRPRWPYPVSRPVLLAALRTILDPQRGGWVALGSPTKPGCIAKRTALRLSVEGFLHFGAPDAYGYHRFELTPKGHNAAICLGVAPLTRKE